MAKAKPMAPEDRKFLAETLEELFRDAQKELEGQLRFYVETRLVELAKRLEALEAGTVFLGKKGLDRIEELEEVAEAQAAELARGLSDLQAAKLRHPAEDGPYKHFLGVEPRVTQDTKTQLELLTRHADHIAEELATVWGRGDALANRLFGEEPRPGNDEQGAGVPCGPGRVDELRASLQHVQAWADRLRSVMTRLEEL